VSDESVIKKIAGDFMKDPGLNRLRRERSSLYTVRKNAPGCIDI
jgi:hypothetical protein